MSSVESPQPADDATPRRWTVAVRLRGDAPSLRAVEEALGAVGEGAPAARLDADGVQLRVTVEAASVEQALRLGVARTRAATAEGPLARAAVVGAEVADEDRGAGEGPPPLVGVDEVADLLGLSPTQVRELGESPRFPTPVAWLAQGPVWTRAHVERYRERLEALSG